MKTARCGALLATMVLFGFAGVACGAGAPTGTVADAPSSAVAGPGIAEDRAAVLAAAAHQIVTVDNSFGGGADPFTAVDLVERFGADGHPLVQDADGAPLTDADRAAIAAVFAPRPITWVPLQHDPAAPETMPGTSPTPEPIRATVLLGVPVVDGSTASVSVYLRCGMLCGSGGTYSLRKTDGRWSVTGTIGGWGVA